jgi:protein-disulfide isomerase
LERLLLAAALVVVAVIVARVLQRRRPEPPTQSRAYQVPQQLDRADFDHVEVPWLVVVFTSTTCDSCAAALEKAHVLASAEVAVQEVSYQARKDLHQRYAVEAAPTIVVVDPEGVVGASFVGVPSATDLWAAVAEARNEPS